MAKLYKLEFETLAEVQAAAWAAEMVSEHSDSMTYEGMDGLSVKMVNWDEEGDYLCDSDLKFMSGRINELMIDGNSFLEAMVDVCLEEELTLGQQEILENHYLTLFPDAEINLDK